MRMNGSVDGDMYILADAAWGGTAWWVVNVLTLILALGAGYGQASVLSLAQAPAAASCYRIFDVEVYRAGDAKLDRNVALRTRRIRGRI